MGIGFRCAWGASAQVGGGYRHPDQKEDNIYPVDWELPELGNMRLQTRLRAEN